MYVRAGCMAMWEARVETSDQYNTMYGGGGGGGGWRRGGDGVNNCYKNLSEKDIGGTFFFTSERVGLFPTRMDTRPPAQSLLPRGRKHSLRRGPRGPVRKNFFTSCIFICLSI